MKEVWRDILGHEGAYQISDQGRVRSLDREVVQGNRWGGLSKRWALGRLLSGALDSYGYRQVRLGKALFLVHHLVLEAFGPSRPEGQQTDHINGDRADNRIANLRWVIPADNGRNRHHVRNRTGHIGVSENPGGLNPYWASARDRKGNKVFLGMHSTLDAASEAYLNYRQTQFSHG